MISMRAVVSGVFAAILALVVAASAAGAQTLTFPALTGRVVDDAGILDAGARAALTQKLAALEAKTTDQLVVATVKSLQGTSVEDYGNRLFRNWKLGQTAKNNGVLMLVAPNERKVRIEVGYGLEGTLPDAVTKLIIENGILPRFRANDFAGGIARGVDDVIQVLTGDAEEWETTRGATARAPVGAAPGHARLPAVRRHRHRRVHDHQLQPAAARCPAGEERSAR
jgi:uncharacterized protein